MQAAVEATAGLERLGDTREWGEMLLRLLRLAGWTVTVHRLFGDSGVLVLAERDRLVVYRTGNSIADVASDLFQDAHTRHQRRTRACTARPDNPADGATS